MVPLAEITEKFVSCCKTGRIDPSLPEGVKIYRQLIRDKFDGSLKNAFPITYNLLKGFEWDQIIDAFLAAEDLTSPYLWRMPESLASFIKRRDFATKLDLPYLNDLIDFEWLEIEICMMPDIPRQTVKTLQLNPESRLVSYSYPVFEKKPLPRPMQKGEYYLFAFRHPENGQANFITLTLFYKCVLELIREEPLSGQEALTLAAAAFRLDQNQVLETGGKFLSDLLQQQALFY